MKHEDQVNRWLLVPPAKGGLAALGVLAALIVPTLIRLAVSRFVSESAFLPYLPFVLLAAILLDWRHAAVVAVGSGVIADLLFIGPALELLEEANDIFGFVVFLISSALIIGLVQSVRIALRDRKAPSATFGDALVFSLEDGEAWARSCRDGSSVRLGAQEEVAGMMTDFLAQLELGKRLNR